MSEKLTDRAFDSDSSEIPFSVDYGLDSEPELIAHSWQAWSMSREDFLAGRTDLKARHVHLATFQNFPPVTGELKARATRSGVNYLMLEHYAGAIGDKKRRISEDTKLIDLSSPPQSPSATLNESRAAEIPARVVSNPAETLNATADSIRAARELLRELTPEDKSGPSLSREDVAKIVDEALANAIGQLRAAQPQEKSEIAKLRELIEFQRELQEQFVPQHSEPVINDKDRTLLALFRETGAAREFFRQMREVMMTPESVTEPETLADKVLHLAREFVPYVAPIVAPAISAKLGAFVNGIDASALAQAANKKQPAPAATIAAPEMRSTPHESGAPETDAERVTLDSFIMNIKTDIQEGNDPDEAVADAIKLHTEQPDLAPVVGDLLGRSNDELLSLLYQATGVRLDGLSNARPYLDGLRGGVRGRLEPLGAEATPDGQESRAGVIAP